MTFALAFLYVDIGDPWWKTAVTEMLRSAIRVMPDVHIVQLTDETTPLHPWAHSELRASVKATKENLSQFKGFMVAEYAKQADRPVAFCDADVIWTARPPISDLGAVAVDNDAEALPYRQFFAQTHPATLWKPASVELLDALPPTTWASDAFELALNYQLLQWPGVPVYEPAKTLQWMVHFPGARNRDEMIAFARKLDGGEHFKEFDPGYVPPPKPGPNEDLLNITFTPPPAA